LAEQGQDEVSMALVRRGVASLYATEAQLRVPYYLALPADACGKTGQEEAGLALLAEALVQARPHREHWWEAEVCRLQGELWLGSHGRALEPRTSTSNPCPRTIEAEVEGCFKRAIAVARQQQDKSLELRAARSLSCMTLSIAGQIYLC
jgi:predicted ATPase